MATTKTTTKKTTTRKTTAKKAEPKKTTEVVEEVKEVKADANDALKEQNEQLLAMIAQMQSQIIALQSNNAQPKEQSGLSALNGKQIKLVSLMKCPINISTEPDGQGTVKTFEKYGDTRMVKFDVLSDMVASYKNTFEKGLIYIADKTAVDELGLTDEYDKICDKKVLDEISDLMTDSAVELFCNIDEALQESVATDIARNMTNGQKYDLNKIRDIKERTKFDIEKMADAIEEEKRVREEHDNQ
jgi:hypothetical protein